MYCTKCGAKLNDNAKFCSSCGGGIGAIAIPYENNQYIAQEKNKAKAIIKCGNCEYVGSGEFARRTISEVLAFLCIFFAPIITILYFFGTYKYRCPKCKSTFLGVKNKKGVFAGQKGGAGHAVLIFIYILVGIAIIGFIASILVVSLNNAREKANQAKENAVNNVDTWQTFNSAEDQFSVLLPTYPTIESKEDLPTDSPVLTYSYHNYTAKDSQAIYYVYKYTYSSTIDTSDSDNLLQALLDGMVNADSNNILISSNKTSVDSYNALDFLIQNQKEYLKGRIILADQTRYALLSEYLAQNYNADNYNKFINSFKIQ